MRNTNTKSIKDLSFSNNEILQNLNLQNIKGGAQSLEQFLKVDAIKCENYFRKIAKTNGDGLW